MIIMITIKIMLIIIISICIMDHIMGMKINNNNIRNDNIIIIPDPFDRP